MDQIWDEYFTPWFKRLKKIDSTTPLPSRGTWRAARRTDEFKDVQRRPKHFHCRCTTCADLNAQLLKTFSSGGDYALYLQARRIHDQEKDAWRQLEERLKAKARSPRTSTLLLMYDDTSALGLPRFTNRTYKNLGHERFMVVPWLVHDYSSNRMDYVYMTKGRYKKGANRLISLLQACIKRVKSNPAHPAHTARDLVLIADNYSENKNKTMLAWAQDMVERKWFDSVEFLFGPVGHTHNGVDATHEKHNNKVGNQVSGDLGHYAFNYRWGFPTEAKRPHVAILQDNVMDWTSYYSPVVRGLSGMTNTPDDKWVVRGIRIARGPDGVVDVSWKKDPVAEADRRLAHGFHTTGLTKSRGA